MARGKQRGPNWTPPATHLRNPHGKSVCGMAGAGGKFAPLTEAATCKLCLRYYPSGFAPK
jgi:hypothetical protein